jgi:putative sigma-54 modulation protein
MTLKIQSVHFDADKKLLDFVEERINKLKHLHEGIISNDVTLRLDKSSDADNKVAEIKLHIAGHDLFAKKQSKTFEEAFDATVDALKVQIIKHKEKIQGV